jgi:DNA-binding NtrC family response regulator
VVRLGGKRSIPVDVRVIASTEGNLEERLKAGAFRADLYGLLSSFIIPLPPLRERAEDIPLLVDRSLERLRLQFGRTLTVPPATLEILCRYPWPGNVAELGSVMELACFNADGKEVAPEHLPESVRGLEASAEDGGIGPVRTIKELEKLAIINALKAARGNHSRAAQSLSISRNTLYRKMKELEIRNPERQAR